MKKIVSGLAAAAVIATSGMAEDINFDSNKAYLVAGAALEMVDEYDMGVAVVLGGGIPFMQAGEGTLVAETELTYSVVAPSWDYDFGYYGGKGSVDATFMTLGAYAGWQYNLNQELFIKPRLGLIYRSVDIDVNGYDGSDSEIGLAFGVQGGMKLSEALDVTVGLNLVDGSDIMHITGGVQYHF
jgi:hypothetical protein